MSELIRWLRHFGLPFVHLGLVEMCFNRAGALEAHLVVIGLCLVRCYGHPSSSISWSAEATSLVGVISGFIPWCRLIENGIPTHLKFSSRWIITLVPLFSSEYPTMIHFSDLGSIFFPIRLWQVFLVHHSPCHVQYVLIFPFGYTHISSLPLHRIYHDSSHGIWAVW